MTSTVSFPPLSRMPYCSVHERTWIEELDHWVACLEPPVDGSSVTEVSCDICMGCAFETFRAQFPRLYASGA